MGDLGLLGPEYTFHDMARAKFLPHYAAHYFDSFTEIFEALREGKITHALVATENSSSGLIERNAERISSEGHSIIDSFTLPIQLQVGSRFPRTLDRIKKIYSHPMAIKETSRFFRKYSHITFISTSSTAAAIEELLNHNERDAAVIAGQEALAHYQLLNVAKNIQDEPNNQTTFTFIKK